MFSNLGKPMKMIGTYVGGKSPTLRTGHEYKFTLSIDPGSGYWSAAFQEPKMHATFSCMDALYENFMHMKMIMPDGHIVAF